MLVFIDESGDPGFKLDSSSCLVISMVIFQNYEQADITRTDITDLARRTGIKPEFRFTNCSDRVRQMFFESIENHSFSVKSIVMHKHNIHSHFLRNHPTKFYNFTLRQLVSNNGLDNAKVRIDGNSKREFQKAAYSYLRKETPPGTISNLKFIDSRKDPLIQMADMVVGAIARTYNEQKSNKADLLLKKIRAKIDKPWEFR